VIVTGGKSEKLGEYLLRRLFANKNLKGNHPVMNRRLRGKKPALNRLRHSTASTGFYPNYMYFTIS
jgi:hypothetical protein